MTATLLTQGIVRATRPLSSRKSGEVFGTEVSVMTQVGTSLGETLKVVIFDREGQTPPAFVPGSMVVWVVEVEAGRYGLSASFVREASRADLDGMSVGVPTFDVDVESVPAAGRK